MTVTKLELSQALGNLRRQYTDRLEPVAAAIDEIPHLGDMVSQERRTDARVLGVDKATQVLKEADSQSATREYGNRIEDARARAH
jgi:hypothetical protein